MTLSDQDKQRILEEEKERLKIRQQLQSEQSQKPLIPKKKIPKWLPIGCGGLFVLVIIIIIIAAVSGGGDNQSASPAYSGPEVVYEITGTAVAVDVTLSNASGGTEQFSGVHINNDYRYSYDYFPASYLYISAQNDGGVGTVTVSIYVKGNLVKTSTSSGSYVIASASAYK